MNYTSGFALKTGRHNSKLGLIPAAMKMNMSERTLRKYEKNEIKRKDPNIYLNGMKIYNDVNIGLAYLSEDPVYRELFGNGGDGSLLDIIVKKLKAALHTMIDEYFNNNHRPGFA